MLDRLLKIIAEEDKKNPLTDKEIAERLKVKREVVTQLRLEHNIPDSRERRRPFIIRDIENIRAVHDNASIRQITKKLKDKGYRVSRYVVEEILKEGSATGKVSENVSWNVSLYADGEKNKNLNRLSFEEIIGYDGSLRTQISQAKAAILYPPNGLHTLILGPSGTGKTQLAEAMYKFGIQSGRFKNNTPFVVFNCADYADNPQLLLAQLFGYEKGAFTGAEKEKQGLVEKADGGILFLDEIHRLPGEGQEILFFLLDRGRFRRLGDTENERNARIMLIAATTENPESSLLITFRRRIPMVIELPSLDERPLSERFKLINHFFAKEASRVNKTVIVSPDAVKALMVYNCPGNIGQLRSDIQVACARGFLNSMGEKSEIIRIRVSELPHYVSIELKKTDNFIYDFEEYITHELIVTPDASNKVNIIQDRYTLPEQIYEYIEEKFIELKRRGLATDEIYQIIGSKVETQLNKFANRIKSKSYLSKADLGKIIGKEFAEIIDRVFKIAKDYFENIQDELYYCLAIHLNTTYERIKEGKKIINPQLDKVKKDYPLEYKVAAVMAEEINKSLDIKLPEDEIGFMATYLRLFSREKDMRKNKIKVVILSHGHVATALADVANKLLGVNHAVGIDMDLNESPESILDRTVDIIRKIDEGRGCILLVDMGSLVTFGDIITKRTGIPVKTVARVDIVMVLEAVRRAILPDATLDEIVSALEQSKMYNFKTYKTVQDSSIPKAVVTVCITGRGTALRLKNHIEDFLKKEVSENIEVIPVGVISSEEMDSQISRIKKHKQIIAYVGTINPMDGDIPYISLEEIFTVEGMNRLKNIIWGSFKQSTYSIEELVKEELIVNDLDVYTKNDVIDMLVDLLQKYGYVEKEFLLDVYKREAMGETVSKGGIAIPHGLPNHVTKPAIAIAKLKRAVIWEADHKVDLVFMIAYKSDSSDYFKSLYKVLLNQEVLNSIKKASNSREIRDLIVLNAGQIM
ncbi:sigma 54-interacting transcriptional regulator [Thermoanaerobacterium sp. DL9XJH110]|uniref:sigma 54-interacting transcriptional regulator n=1 Tax=Thermoanaerobacterium sp. DL9XJH110 TaxID=3386643 RepID=UPI003BB7C8C0